MGPRRTSPLPPPRGPGQCRRRAGDAGRTGSRREGGASDRRLAGTPDKGLVELRRYSAILHFADAIVGGGCHRYDMTEQREPRLFTSPPSTSIRRRRQSGRTPSLVAGRARSGPRALHHRLAERAGPAPGGRTPELTSPYVSSVPGIEQFPGDRAIVTRLASIMRWNALAILLRANSACGELGGHIASCANAADLFEANFTASSTRAPVCAAPTWCSSPIDQPESSRAGNGHEPTVVTGWFLAIGFVEVEAIAGLPMDGAARPLHRCTSATKPWVRTICAHRARLSIIDVSDSPLHAGGALPTRRLSTH